MYMWVENWICCFSCVPTVNVPNCPDCLPFVPDPISATGGDSFVIYFTLSYLHDIILAELPVPSPPSSGSGSDLSAKACLILEGQWCPGPGSLPAAPALYQFWVLVLCDPPALVLAAKLYFPGGLWVCLKNVSGCLQWELVGLFKCTSAISRESTESRRTWKSPLQQPLVVLASPFWAPRHFFLVKNVKLWPLCPALSISACMTYNQYVFI